MLMAEGDDHYKVLGLQRNASCRDIKKQYQELIKRVRHAILVRFGLDYLLQCVIMFTSSTTLINLALVPRLPRDGRQPNYFTN